MYVQFTGCLYQPYFVSLCPVVGSEACHCLTMRLSPPYAHHLLQTLARLFLQIWHRQEHWESLAQGGAAQGLQDRLQAGPDVHHRNVGVLQTTSFSS